MRLTARTALVWGLVSLGATAAWMAIAPGGQGAREGGEAPLPGSEAPLPGSAALLPISYGVEIERPQRRDFPISVDAGAFSSSQLQPAPAASKSGFRWAQSLGIAFPELRLDLVYRDGAPPGPLGSGWSLRLEETFEEEVAIDLFSQGLEMVDPGGEATVVAGDQWIPVRRAGPDVWLSRRSYRGRTYAFAADPHREEALLLAEILTASATLRFRYEKDGSILSAIVAPGRELSLAFDGGEDRARVSRRVSKIISGADRGVSETWELRYDSAAGRDFLREVLYRGARGEHRLEFSYGAFASLPDPSTALETAQGGAKAAGNSNWKRAARPLPDQLTIRGRPAVQLVNIDTDDFPDVIESGPTRLRAWLWDPSRATWKPFTAYRLPRAFFRERTVPTGSSLQGLAKIFGPDDPRNTLHFNSVFTSYYDVDEDGEALRYHKAICFPHVRHGEFDPDPDDNLFQCETDPVLALPIPLQFESRKWPTDLPGHKAVEGFKNQAAQILSLNRQGRIDIFYIGQRYRDAKTDEILVAPHRDTKNCRERYTTTWRRLGVSREVKVDTCQALWTARTSEWHGADAAEGDFWLRRDLTDGKPNGAWVFPWREDHAYHFHYEAFRNVRFAKLHDAKGWAAVVDGPACGGENCPDGPHPAVRDIYRLRGSRWRIEPADSSLFPLDSFFAADGLFADLDANGIDDAITPGSRAVHLNTGDKAARWQRDPRYDIPAECNLRDGSCRLVDLDADLDLDLFIGSGRTIFLNQSVSLADRRLFAMTTFTDETGALRPVPEDGTVPVR